MRILIVIFIALGASAREVPEARTWWGRCARLLSLVKKPSRDSLVTTLLRANAETPQRDDYIYLATLAEYLTSPLPSATLFADVSPAESIRLSRGMDRAHAAYGVRAFSEFETVAPPIKRVTLERIQGLMVGPSAALALLLESLRDEMKRMPFEHRRLRINPYAWEYLNLDARERRLVRAANDDFFYFGNSARRKQLADWGVRLKAVLNLPTLREGAKAWRGSISELVSIHGAGTMAFEVHRDRLLHVFATRILAECRREFGHAAEDEPLWNVIRELQTAMYARPGTSDR